MTAANPFDSPSIKNKHNINEIFSYKLLFKKIEPKL